MTSAYSGIRWGSGMPRQFQYERTQSRIGGNLWEYPMRFVENSPVFMADRVQTPIMMLHNDNDDAVPWYQGIEYFLALRRLGKQAYLFNYNGEPHGLRKRQTRGRHDASEQSSITSEGARPDPNGWTRHPTDRKKKRISTGQPLQPKNRKLTRIRASKRRASQG